MHKKKILAVIVAAAMLLSFTACNSGNTGSSDTSSSDNSSVSSESGMTSTSDSTASAPAGNSVLNADIAEDTVIATATTENGLTKIEITFGDFLKEYKYFLAAYNVTDDTQEPYASTLTDRREYIVNYLINDKVMESKFNEFALELTDEDEKQIDEDTETGADEIKSTLKEQQRQLAAAKGLNPTESELDDAAEEAFYKLLSDCGLTFDDFRNWQKAIVIQEKLNEIVNEDTAVDRAEAVEQAEKLVENAKREYEADKSGYDPDTLGALWLPEGTRNIQHILLKFSDEDMTEIMQLRSEGKNDEADTLRTEKLASLQTKIDEVSAKVAAGEDFSVLMKEYSQDGDTSAVYVVNIGTEKYMDGFAECALAIPEIGGTDTVVTDYGWHMIKYISDTVVDPDIYEEYVDGIHQYLIEATESVKLSEAMKEWRGAYTIEINRDLLLLAKESEE